MNSKNILTIDLDWIQNDYQKIQIISFCVNLFKNKIDTFFIKSHHHAYELIPENSYLYNIDHHHDICYNKESEYLIKSNFINEGNWVLALAKNKNLQGYTWIKNLDSDLQEHHVYDELRHLNTFKIFNKLSDLEIDKVDKVIICESLSYSNNVNLSFIFELLKQLHKDLNCDINENIKHNDFSWIKIK